MKRPALLLSAAFFFASAATGVMAGETGLHVTGDIKVGGTGGWDYATFDPATHKLYLSHNASIATVDVNTKAVVPHLADAVGAHEAIALADGKTLMITSGHADQVTFNDAGTGAILATVAADKNPDAAVVDPFTGYAFVMANDGGIVDVIDVKTHALVRKINAGGAPEAAASDGAGLVLTHLEDKNAIVVIDAKTLTVKTTYAMADCDKPSGLAFAPESRLLLSACHNGVARITKADTGEEVGTVAIGTRPDFAIYDPKAHLGYIPCGDGTLSVISLDGKPHVVDVIKTEPGARTAALDTETGQLYLPTADFGAPATAGGRPSVVADSFRLVVVGK